MKLIWTRKVLVFAFLFPWLAFAQESRILPFPAESCAREWSRLSPEDYLFDFQKDSSLTPRGNEGYEAYRKRMSDKGADRKDCHKAWTVLIYMSAPPDLLPYALADLHEMEAGIGQKDGLTGSGLRSDVVVQINTEQGSQSRRLHVFQNTAVSKQPLTKDQVTHLKQSQVSSPIVYFDESPALKDEKQRLLEFLKWGVQEYPSEHYLVVIWGHGQGWNSGMTSQRDVLNEFKQWVGGRVDIYASDQCLMQSVEDAVEVAEHCEFVCGSEDIQSYAGFPYGSIICQLNSGRFAEAYTRASHEEATQGEAYLAAWMIPQLYKESFEPEKGTQWHLDPDKTADLTGCSVSCKHIRTTLVPYLSQLGYALLNFIEEKPERWMRVRSLIDDGEVFQGGTQDLGVFLKGLKKILKKEFRGPSQDLPKVAFQLKTALKKAYRALEYSVVNAALGENYRKKEGAKGLSIWLPQSDEEFQDRVHEFAQSTFYGGTGNDPAPGWKAFMLRMYLKSEFR